MIVINIKDGYNINRRNVKYNFVTDEKLSLLSWINKPSLFNTVVPNHHPNPELLNVSYNVTKNIKRICLKLFLLENGDKDKRKTYWQNV